MRNKRLSNTRTVAADDSITAISGTHSPPVNGFAKKAAIYIDISSTTATENATDAGAKA
jgi:hypothetical protein